MCILIVSILILEIVIGLYFYFCYKTEKNYILSLIEEEMKGPKLTYKEDLLYFLRKTFIYKFLFYSLNLMVLSINILIPVLNKSLPEKDRIIISIMAAIASVATGVITLTNCNKNWTRHRNTYERLKYLIENFNYVKGASEKSFEEFFKMYQNVKYGNLDLWIEQRSNSKSDKK